MARLTNAAIRHQVYLERLKTAEAGEYNKLIALLDKQIREALAALGSPVQNLTRGRLNGLIRELRAAQKAALEKSNDALIRRLRNIAAYEAKFEADTLTALTPAGYTVAPASTTTAWTASTTTPMSANGDLLEPFLRTMSQREVDQINKVILRGANEGWTNDEIIRTLRGSKKLNYNDGLLKRMGKHNATLVRTAVQHVSSTARQATWEENDDIISGYRWVSTLDSRTTSQCRTLDGEVFELGKGPRPPIHMNCRSVTVAIIKGLEDLSSMLTRASAEGQVRGNLTYYEWLKTQDASFQDMVLGPTRGELLRKGGLSADRFAELQLGSAFRPLTLAEMRKLEPEAFIRAGI